MTLTAHQHSLQRTLMAAGLAILPPMDQPPASSTAAQERPSPRRDSQTGYLVKTGALPLRTLHFTLSAFSDALMFGLWGNPVPNVFQGSGITGWAPAFTNPFSEVYTAPSEIETHIVDRITVLKSLAADEGLVVSEASERELLAFAGTCRVKIRPALAVLDNGNLRAQWRGTDGKQVSLQFRGGGEIQFVFLVPKGPILANAAGRDTVDGIIVKLRSEGLLGLLTG